MNRIKKIEDSTLWRTVSGVAQQVYGLSSDLPEAEQWVSSKLRLRAFDVTQDVAEALGSIDPQDVRWHLGFARHDLFGIKNALSFARKMGLLDVQPELMLLVDKAVNEVDVLIDESTKQIPEWPNGIQPSMKGPKHEG